MGHGAVSALRHEWPLPQHRLHVMYFDLMLSFVRSFLLCFLRIDYKKGLVAVAGVESAEEVLLGFWHLKILVSLLCIDCPWRSTQT